MFGCWTKFDKLTEFNDDSGSWCNWFKRQLKMIQDGWKESNWHGWYFIITPMNISEKCLVKFYSVVPDSMFYNWAEVRQGDSATVLPSFGYQQSILSVYTIVLFYFLSTFIRPKWDRVDLLLFYELNEQYNLIRFATATKIIENQCE